MKSMALKWASVACLCASSLAAKDEHPIGKVITLLDELKSKAEAEGKVEALSFQKFEYWCKGSSKELNTAITTEKETIDELESKIDAKTKEAKALGDQIAKLEKELTNHDLRGTESDEARTKQNELYEEVDADFEATIEATKAALEALTDAKEDTNTGFLQRQHMVSQVLPLLSARATDEELSKIEAFVQTDPKQVMAAGDAGAHEKKYSFKSMGIVELLKKLQEKFEDERLTAEKEETNAVNSYELATQAREAQITAGEKSKQEKTDLLAETNTALETAKGDLSDTQQDMEADTGSLEETTKSCQVKTSEWQERSEIRSGEIEAMGVAKKILAKVGGVRTEAPGNPIPPASPLEGDSFLQIDDPKMKAVAFLRKEAHLAKSKALQRLAQEIQAHLTGPFDDVNAMVQKMIFRLMAEQKDEDDHKNWCDLEVKKTENMVTNKEDKISDLTTKIDDIIAKIAKLTEDISEAEDMVAKIEMFMQQAREIREVGHKENELAIKDAKDAQDAVANAIAVLTDFYKESGQVAKEPYEFVQKDPVQLPENPQTWDSSYTGVSNPTDQPAGIITVMETCASDFSQMQADTEAQEATDEQNFKDAIQENDIEKSRRAKETEMKSSEKKRFVEKQTELDGKRKHVADELEQTVQYQKDLQPACVEGDSSYEDRKAARSQEVEALHQAQSILEDAFKEKPEDDATLVQSGQRFLPVRKH